MNMKDARHVVFDVETTGLSPGNGDRIIEIGAVAVAGGNMGEEFHSLIQVSERISREVQRIHGITNETLKNAPMPEVVFSRFRDFIRDSALVAHNARFDVGFLRREFERLRLSLNNRWVCTLAMSRRRFPHLRNHKLDTVYRSVVGREISDYQRHRALDDARMVAAIWLAMKEK